jgi:uncharacterized protein (TIGR02452 family)
MKSDSVAAILDEPSSTDVITALIFSDSKNIGGGILCGALPQEECLVRAMSALIPTLTILADAGAYPLSNGKILSVPFVEVTRRSDHSVLAAKRTVHTIFTAAPDMRVSGASTNSGFVVGSEDYIKYISGQIEMQIKAAIALKTDVFVAGAWGTGVFQNPHAVVAQTYKDTLSRYNGHFKKVIFPIPEGVEDKKLNFSKVEVDNPARAFRGLNTN